MIVNKIADIIICERVIKTDNVCNKTKFLLFFVSDALLIAGMRNMLVGIVVMKILNAKPIVRLLIFKLNNIIRADTTNTYP